MKKILSIVLSIVMLLSMAVVASAETDNQTVTLNYPETLQRMGFTEPVVLDKMPERVVVMSTAPVLALYELGVNMIAIPKTSVVEWPEDLAANAEQLAVTMNTNFDIETVVAMEPDLVIMGYTSQETYGVVLESVDIPVYYVDAGHTVSYESIKAQTQILIDAFAPGSEIGASLMQRFADLEARLETLGGELEGKTCMVLQSSPPSHYIQTADGTLGSMCRMIGLTNVYENDASSMVQIDYELALDYDPDVVLAVGMSPTGEAHKELMLADFENNHDYWYSIEAIANEDVIWLPVTYCSTAGINVIDNINALADLIEAHFAE